MLVIALTLFACSTRAGSAWLVSMLAQDLSPIMSLEDFDGQLFGQFSVGKLLVSVDSAEVSVSDLNVAWRPAGLLQRKLVIHRLAAQKIELKTSLNNGSETPALELRLPNLPLVLELRGLRANLLDLSIRDRRYQFENLQLTTKWSSETLEIIQLAASIGEQQLSLGGKVQNRLPIDLNAKFEWSGIANSLSSNATMDLSGPISDLRFKGSTAGLLHSRVAGAIDLSNASLPFTMEFHHDEIRLPPNSAVHIDSGTLNASGSMKTVKLQYEVQGASNNKGPLNLRVQGQVNGFDALDKGIDGALDWQFEHPLLGGSRLSGQTVMTFQHERLNLESSTDAPFASTLSASLNPLDAEQKLTAAFTWHDLRVPGIPNDTIIARNGRIDFNGTLARAAVSLQSVWSHHKYGAAQIDASGMLNKQSLTLTHGSAEILKGTVDYTGVVDWHQNPKLDLDIAGKQLDVSVIRPDLEALIDLTAAVHVSAADPNPQTTITLKQFSGAWLGQALNASGKISIQPQLIIIDNLQTAVGDNRIAIDLSLSDMLIGAYEINAPNLSDFDPQFRGQLSGAGHVAGTRAKPLLNGKLSGKDLKIFSWALNKLDLDYDLSPFSTRPSNLHGDVQGLRQYGSETFTANASIRATGEVDGQQAEIKIDTDDLHLAAAVTGTWREDTWQGSLDTLSILDETLGAWAIREKTGFQINRRSDFVLRNALCIEQAKAGICLNSAARQKGHTSMDGELSSIPIAIVNFWLPSALKASGELSGGFSIKHGKDGTTGTGNYAIDNGKITAAINEDPPREIPIEKFSGQFATTGDIANLGISARIGDWLDLTIKARLPSDPAGTVEGTMAGVSEDIAWLGEFVPDLAGSNGRMEINAKVSGRRDHPTIEATTSLKNGALALPATGLRFETFDIALKSTQSHVLTVDLRAKPQKGELNLTGKLVTRPEKNWPFEFKLDGESFSAARLPELEMDITPSLDIIGDSEKIAVTGKVEVPYFSYTLNEIPKTAVRVSSDTVLVGANDIQSTPREAAAKWFEQSVFLDVDVLLGEQVSVAGLGMFAMLGGSVEVAKDLNDEIKGSGTVLIASGKFDPYGHALSIENGRMMFAGPITNPNLNIRAVRDNIPVIAGVAITGSARAPKFDVFSDPALPDAEALSYVIVGRPLGEGTNADASLISQAALGFGLEQSAMITNQLRDLFSLDEFGLNTSGDIDQTALIAGKQLTPKVSVRTEMNIFDQLWSFFLRYKLTEKWSIEAESGERQGADIIYNVESESILDFNPFK